MGAPQRFTHDYKDTDFSARRPIRRLPWFVAGVGIPLICLALIAPGRQTETPIAPETLIADTPVEDTTTTDILEPVGEVAVAAAATDEEIEIAVEAPPLPGTELTMTVRRGDSLDRMFKTQ